ncbi:MAG: 2-C-methyl-D-erythritol 4-phosphate cytidylyltransferase [Brevinematia bacterium]
MKTAAIVLAGGSGKRFGGNLPKQFVKLCGKAILSYSIEKFLNEVDFVVVVCHRDYIELLKNEIIRGKFDVMITDGGETRQLSVRNGLLSLKNAGIDYVAIHDGSRPLFSKDLMRRLFVNVLEKKAVIPALPLTSTIARVKNGNVEGYLYREELFLIQTPQVFEFGLIFDAHERAFREKKIDFTDDSQLIRFAGEKVYVIQGEEKNIKITTREDLLLAEWLCKKRKV